jgi:hypothetical protein
MLRSPWLAWVTCLRDGLTHAVSNRRLGIAVRTRSLVYRSLCGHRVFPRQAHASIGPFCEHCQALSRRTAASTRSSVAVAATRTYSAPAGP